MPSASSDHALTLLVRKLESIGRLSNEEREAVMSLPIRTQGLLPKQDIVREGDTPSQTCLLVEGWAYRYKLLGEGRRQILSFHVGGDTPDLESLHVQSMDHSLGTLTRCTVAFISHSALRDLTARHPNVAAALWRDTLVDAGIFRAWMIGLGRRSAYERIAHLFCEMYLKLEAAGLADGHRCQIPLTQCDLADALGLTPVHVNRVLQSLRGQGLITLKGSNLVVERWDELVETGEFDPAYLQLS